MAYSSCASGAVTNPASCTGPASSPPPPLPGNGPFFEDVSALLSANPVQRNYGVAVTDTNADGIFEFVVAGYGVANLIYQWDGSRYQEIAPTALQDASGRAIGVAACDVDEDGYEELYVLNTDQYSGATTTSDKLFDRDGPASYVELFSLPENSNAANYVAGRSCACVDRMSNGKYAVMVANYGGPMRLFEISTAGTSRTLHDVAAEAGVALTTGGRALVAGPIVSHNMDIFANNEGWSGGRRLEDSEERRRLSHMANFFFENQGSGSFVDRAAQIGLLDSDNTGRGTALFDANHDGLIDIVYGNWQGTHRLFLQSRDAGGTATFSDVAPSAMAAASPIRTVIVADFDNDGFEEIFCMCCGGSNWALAAWPCALLV